MSTLAQEKTYLRDDLERPGSGISELPQAESPSSFHSFLTQAILTSRWLETYCTPCQARGAMVWATGR